VSLKAVSLVELKLGVLSESERSGETVAEVCRRQGISRASYYRYRRRYLEEGVVGLEAGRGGHWVRPNRSTRGWSSRSASCGRVIRAGAPAGSAPSSRGPVSSATSSASSSSTARARHQPRPRRSSRRPSRSPATRPTRSCAASRQSARSGSKRCPSTSAVAGKERPSPSSNSRRDHPRLPRPRAHPCARPRPHQTHPTTRPTHQPHPPAHTPLTPRQMTV
jgi:hypothetical protein